MRLAIFVILVLMLHWVLSAGHVLGMYELALFIMGASGALFGASLVWLLYLALEPNVRRRWPWILISWSRLLAGRIRDPLVGRDLFAGTLLGIGMSLFVASTRFVMDWSGLMRLAPAAIQPSALMGMRFVMSDLLLSVPVYLFSSLAALFLLLLLRIMARKNWLAGLLFVLIFAAYGAAGSRVPAYGLVVAGVLWTTILLVLTRLGLLALVACFCVLSLTQSFLLTLNPSDWWAPTTWFAMAVVMALAVFAFRTGLGSRPLFSGALLNE